MENIEKKIDLGMDAIWTELRIRDLTTMMLIQRF